MVVVKIPVEVEVKNIAKNMSKIGGAVSKATSTFPTPITNKNVSGGVMKNIGEIIGKIGKSVIGQLASIVSIIGILFYAMKPITNSLKNILKVISLFITPITYVLGILLKMLLILLFPGLKLFMLFMRPFYMFLNGVLRNFMKAYMGNPGGALQDILVDFISSTFSIAPEKVEKVMNNIIKALKKVFNFFVGFVNGIIKGLSEGDWSIVKKYIAEIGAFLFDVLNRAIRKFNEFLKTNFGVDVLGALAKVYDFLFGSSGLFTNFNAFLQNLAGIDVKGIVIGLQNIYEKLLGDEGLLKKITTIDLLTTYNQLFGDKGLFTKIITTTFENVIEEVDKLIQNITGNNSFSLKNTFKQIANFIKNPLIPAMKSFIGVIVGMYNKIKSLKESAEGIVRSIRRKAESIWDSLTRHHRSADDFILTPSGQLIKTNPNDYIFGMKNPQGLGASYNITINVSSVEQRDIARQVEMAIKNALRSRGV